MQNLTVEDVNTMKIAQLRETCRNLGITKANCPEYNGSSTIKLREVILQRIAPAQAPEPAPAPNPAPAPEPAPVIPAEIPYIEVYNAGPVIRYLYHISDIHIPYAPTPDNRLEGVFKALYAKLGQELRDDALIVITGDTFDKKGKFTTNCLAVFHALLAELTKLCPVILICGNHDIVENNMQHEDNISAALGPTPYPNLYYLKNSGIYRYNNILFGVSSLLTKEMFVDGPSTNLKKSGPDDCSVALFHGDLYRECQNETYNRNKKPEEFAEFDLVLLGDQHEPDFIKPNMAYAGSLMQLNFGERPDGHGYIKWDVMTRTGKVEEVANPAKLLYMSAELSCEELVARISMLPKQSIIRLKIGPEHDITKIKTMEDLIKKSSFKYQGLHLVAPKITAKVPEQIGEVNEIELLKKLGATAEMIKIHNNFISEVKKGKNYNELNKIAITYLEFKNICSYSKDKFNIVHFGKHNSKIIGIDGPNAAGKSTIISVVRKCLFNEIENPGFRNHEAKTFAINMELVSNAHKYQIRMRSEKQSNEDKVKKQFIRLTDNVCLNGIDEKETGGNICEHFGTEKEFIFSNVLSKNTYDTLLLDGKHITDTLQKKYGLSRFEPIKKLCKDTLKVEEDKLKSQKTVLTEKKSQLKFQQENLNKDLAAIRDLPEIVNVDDAQLPELIVKRANLETKAAELKHLHLFQSIQLQDPTIVESMTLEKWQEKYNKIKSKLENQNINYSIEEINLQIAKYDQLVQEYDAKIKSPQYKIINDEQFGALKVKKAELESKIDELQFLALFPAIKVEDLDEANSMSFNQCKTQYQKCQEKLEKMSNIDKSPEEIRAQIDQYNMQTSIIEKEISQFPSNHPDITQLSIKHEKLKEIVNEIGLLDEFEPEFSERFDNTSILKLLDIYQKLKIKVGKAPKLSIDDIQANLTIIRADFNEISGNDYNVTLFQITNRQNKLQEIIQEAQSVKQPKSKNISPAQYNTFLIKQTIQSLDERLVHINDEITKLSIESKFCDESEHLSNQEELEVINRTISSIIDQYNIKKQELSNPIVTNQTLEEFRAQNICKEDIGQIIDEIKSCYKKKANIYRITPDLIGRITKYLSNSKGTEEMYENLKRDYAIKKVQELTEKRTKLIADIQSMQKYLLIMDKEKIIANIEENKNKIIQNQLFEYLQAQKLISDSQAELARISLKYDKIKELAIKMKELENELKLAIEYKALEDELNELTVILKNRKFMALNSANELEMVNAQIQAVKANNDKIQELNKIRAQQLSYSQLLIKLEEKQSLLREIIHIEKIFGHKHFEAINAKNELKYISSQIAEYLIQKGKHSEHLQNLEKINELKKILEKIEQSNIWKSELEQIRAVLCHRRYIAEYSTNELKNIEAQISSINLLNKDNIKNEQEKQAIKRTINQMEQGIEKIRSEIKQLEDDITSQERHVKILSEYSNIIAKAPATWLRDRLDVLNYHIGYFIRVVTTKDLSLRVVYHEASGRCKTPTFRFEASLDQKFIRLENSSGYESAVLALSVKYALAVTSLECVYDTLFIDEGLDCIDDANSVEHILHQLQYAFPKIYVISHREDIKRHCNEFIKIVPTIVNGKNENSEIC